MRLVALKVNEGKTFFLQKRKKNHALSKTSHCHFRNRLKFFAKFFKVSDPFCTLFTHRLLLGYQERFFSTSKHHETLDFLISEGKPMHFQNH